MSKSFKQYLRGNVSLWVITDMSMRAEDTTGKVRGRLAKVVETLG